MFVTDPNKNFWERTWQLTSRFTWEGIQTTVGYYYTQGRNIGGNVDRVDYFGGATWATRENYNGNDRGLSLGNYINMRISDEIDGSFADRVLSDPLFMHEYGHTFDSRIYGLSYLFAIGIPSLFSAKNSELIVKRDAEGNNLNLNGLWTHDVFWTEMRANKHAAKYFRKYYGVEWSYPRYPLSNPF